MTDPIRSGSSRNPSLDFDPPPPAPPASGVKLATKVGEVGLGASIDGMEELQAPPATTATAAAYASFVRAQTTPVPAYTVTAQTSAVQAKLDAFLRTATPTYRLPDGSTVDVPAFFRMAPPAYESKNLEANRGPRDAVAAKLGVGANFDTGRAPLSAIRTVTQGLIDAGRLPKGVDVVKAVRTMSWDHGVGIDCAGYVQKALFASKGGDAAKYGLKSLGDEDLMGLATNAKWHAFSVTQARPGDVLTLARNGDSGHAAIVYENVLASPVQREALQKQMKSEPDRDARVDMVLRDPKLHVIQLDSSWGTGDKVLPGGGVQRRTWLFGEGTGWVCDDAVGAHRFDGATPRGHVLGGTFRPKGET